MKRCITCHITIISSLFLTALYTHSSFYHITSLSTTFYLVLPCKHNCLFPTSIMYPRFLPLYSSLCAHINSVIDTTKYIIGMRIDVFFISLTSSSSLSPITITTRYTIIVVTLIDQAYYPTSDVLNLTLLSPSFLPHSHLLLLVPTLHIPCNHHQTIDGHDCSTQN